MSEAQEILPASLADEPDEVVIQALVDAPEGTGLAESALGRRVIHADNSPGRWVDLCHRARNVLAAQGLASSRYGRYAELAVEEASGMRRTPVGTWDVDHVNQLLAVAEVNIELLPLDDPERLRIENLRLYNGGQASISVGRFGDAARYYEQAAAISTTPFSLGLNAYFVTYCELQDALMGGDEAVIQIRYEEFYTGSERFIAILDRLVETELRWLGNVRCHQRMFDWLSGNEERMANILSLTEVGELEPRAAFHDALELLGAIYLSRQGRHLAGLAYREAQGFAHSQTAGIEWRALAFLFLAEMEEDSGESNRARATLNALIDLRGDGGYMARAIARRRLEGLTT